MKKKIFTLVELLIVVAIIAVLAGLLIPALNSARSKAQDIHCRSNLKTLMAATISYDIDFKYVIPATIRIDGWGRAYWWIYAKSKYLAVNPPKQIYDFRTPDPVGVALCPGMMFGKRYGYGVSVCNMKYPGLTVSVYDGKVVSELNHYRNPSTKILLGDGFYNYRCNRWGTWDYLTPSQTLNTTDELRWASRHRDFSSSNFAFVDGHVESIQVIRYPAGMQDKRLIPVR